jgi:hypothetical protein
MLQKQKVLICLSVLVGTAGFILKTFSAYHNIPFATKSNGFAGLDTELAFNSPSTHQAHSNFR